MGNDAARIEARSARGAIVVRRPQRGDAIGESLRCAFDGDRRLPADLAQVLGALDKLN